MHQIPSRATGAGKMSLNGHANGDASEVYVDMRRVVSWWRNVNNAVLIQTAMLQPASFQRAAAQCTSGIKDYTLSPQWVATRDSSVLRLSSKTFT
jgi:hypothetical protein